MRIILKERKNISVRYSLEQEAIYCYFKPEGRSCFSYELLRDIMELHQDIKSFFQKKNSDHCNIKYLIYMSQTRDVFSYGGDLSMFADMIDTQNEEFILQYGKLAVDLVFDIFTHLDLPLVTISVVDGVALGGGFETALATNITLATHKSTFSLPDMKFNLFPSVGAFTFLQRSVGEKLANRMMLDGVTYSANDLYNIGIVDQVIKDEDISKFLSKFINKNKKSFKSNLAVRGVVNIENPLDRQKLYEIVQLWAKNAMELESFDIKKMRRFAKGQEIKKETSNSLVRTIQDRRFFREEHFPMRTENGIIQRDRRVGQRRVAI